MGDKIRRLPAFLTLVLLLLGSVLAAPASAENVLRTMLYPACWEPHVRNNNLHRTQVWERLLFPGPNAELEPELATSWRIVDPLTWEFALRRGVRFHDGTPFTAEDVIFSIERARTRAPMLDFVSSIDRAEAVDPNTVRFRTTVPDGLLANNLSLIAIMSKDWAERHAVTRYSGPTADSGCANHLIDHANGTGPFKVESFEDGVRGELVRYPDWWGCRPECPHNIDRIVLTAFPSQDDALAAFKRGELDLLQLDAPFPATLPGGRIEVRTHLSLSLLKFDAVSEQLSRADVPGNPLKDRRVREAIFRAIDVEHIVGDALGGQAVTTRIPVANGVPGYLPELDQRPPFDPKRAEALALLDQAGYPNGFTLSMVCRDYIGADVCSAVAEDLAQIGLRAEAQVGRCRTAGTPTPDLCVTGQAGQTDSLAALKYYGSASARTPGPWITPRFDALLTAAERELVTYTREALLGEAWRMILAEVPDIPLYHFVIGWAVRDGLDVSWLPNRADELRFSTARFK